MSNSEIRDIFTQGGCGILAQEIMRLRPDAVPVLWLTGDGVATHAAVKIGPRLLHLGSREDGYTEVSVAQLDEAVRYDFQPRIDADECRELARELAVQIVSELE